MNKYQRLEYARMMGPVAYAEALNRLDEDSRGNMVRLLGINRKWAEFFNAKLGKFAFPFAKWMVALSDGKLFKLDPTQAPIGLPDNMWDESKARLEPVLAAMSPEEAALTTLLLTKSMPGLHPWQPIKSALEFFNVSPKLVSALSTTQKVDLETIGQLLDDAGEALERNQSVSGIGELALSLSGGYEWRTVTDEEFNAFSGPLGNCGEGTGDQMYVLVDAAGKAHVAASYEPQTGLDQIVGYGNSPPKQKYRPMVTALMQHLGTRLARGEKSWGASFVGGPHEGRSTEVTRTNQHVHEGRLHEFLTDLSPNRKEAIQMLSDVVGDNWELLAQRGVDPDGLKYLGTGNNGTAWQMQDGRVLKITTDDAEAHVASFLKGKQFKCVFTVFDVWAFPGQINGHHIYGLVTEGGLQKPSQADQDEFDNMAIILEQVEQDSGQRIEDNFRSVLQYLMADPDIEPIQKRQTLESVKKFNVPGMMADMKKIGFMTDLHSGNFMQRSDGTFVIIDVGTGGDQEDSKPPFLEGHLDLVDGLNEVGILGAPQAGSGSQMRGMGSTAWSGGKLVLADPKDHVPVDDEDEEIAYLDQDQKGLGPNGSNSPY